jgi:hypothetical protein
MLLLQKIGAFVSGCFFDLGLRMACGCGCIRFGKVWKGLERLGEVHCLVPLSERINFATKLQRVNRLQVSKVCTLEIQA